MWLLLGVSAGAFAGCSTPAALPAPPPAPATRLSSLMADAVGPAASELAFQLFHTQDWPLEERCRRLEESAAALESAAGRIASFAPPHFAARRGDFEEIAIALQRHASAMRGAALERSLEEAAFWFSQAKNACAACHETYRFGKQPPVRHGPP